LLVSSPVAVANHMIRKVPTRYTSNGIHSILPTLWGMLSERPESFIALADDHVWSIHSEPGEIINAEKERSFIVFRCRQGGFISDFTQLISQIFLFHDILDRDGMLTLVRNSKTKNQNKSWLLRLQRIFVKNGKQDLANWMNDLISDLVLQGEDLMSDNYRLYDYT